MVGVLAGLRTKEGFGALQSGELFRYFGSALGALHDCALASWIVTVGGRASVRAKALLVFAGSSCAGLKGIATPFASFGDRAFAASE